MLFLKNFLEPLSYLVYFFLLMITTTKTSPLRLKVLLIYYVSAVVITYYASFLSYVKIMGDNNYLYNLFFFITICTFSYYFYSILNSKVKKYIVLILLVFNVLLFIRYDVVSAQFFNTYNNYVTATCNITILTYSLLYFHKLISNVSEQNILEDFNFWLVSSYLIYFLGAFFIIFAYKEKNESQRAIIWSFQNVILFTSALVALTGNLWIKYHRKLR